jgi:hypothetical protein
MVDGGTPGGSVLGPILGGSGTSSYRSSSVMTIKKEGLRWDVANRKRASLGSRRDRLIREIEYLHSKNLEESVVGGFPKLYRLWNGELIKCQLKT